MGSCVSKGSIASSPQHYAVHYTEQATPSPPSSEASMSPGPRDLAALEPPIARRSGARRSVLLPHEVQQAAYQLAMRLNGRPIEDASARQRLADATATVHETRLALHRGRGNVDSDLRLSNGRAATYSSLSYCLGEDDENLLAGSALAAGAGNCDHNAAINTRRHAVRMEDGGQMMTVRDYEQTHLYALYQPPSSTDAEESTVVLDSWGDGPAVLLRDSHWAETYGTSTNIIERFDKPAAIDSLARTNAFRAEIEDPQTALHANARELETAFLANPAPGDIFSAMPVIAPDLAESTRRRLQEHSPRTLKALAADAARNAYGLEDAQANSPRTTKAILKEAKRLDALGRPPLSW
ncbi:XopE/AvrPphe family type III secretion system effector [Pseudomonas syringae]|uniref:Avirulence protein n=3 Tax=Pseudomonas syringae TaxID=317 RepID=A0A3M4KEX0_PSESF|nr:XopE/AvrPphe family type III secretion system effector [Pseudomonas syringae]EPM51253.1 avirulence protein [Pseudomonas syringae pv. actinidiae ICMP 19098]EPN21265.1 avirulence protein [Pseudomonas syringae pv. actinidiae ICMP 19100]EPN28830.1 avirulence protein [Pseudomonas syringae pv. actinidiae ICMP 19099]EPN36990.1 avirulence protein [Pseudomonas syringae pv. actinidiae ICMP 18883]EPN48689.1 avirulence protein [Pseudomonas syringae pv. actinidiae ICMP 19094]